VSVDAFEALADAVAAGDVVEGVLAVERTEPVQDALESLLIEHAATPDALRIPTWRPLARSLGVDDGLRKTWDAADLSAAAREYADGENAVRAVNEVAPFEVRERAPTRIGNRMGRPEKSESRDLSPAVHTLFPINEAGGPQRDVAEAANVMDDTGRRGRHELEVSDRVCPDCGDHTYAALCPDCETHTEPHYECNDCGTVCEPDEAGRVECPNCEWEVTAATYQEVDVNDAYRSALETVGERESAFEILKGVQGLTSRNKTPEPIEKGVLRAKNGVTSFKDGTVRYDMTDLPVTAVKPQELDVTADHFRELGYETDIDGEPLRHDDQVVELRVQDIVLSDGAAEHMLKTADFVDDLLEQFYGLDRFYEVNERDDLVGELVFGMAPHTSAATVGRVVGFTSAAVGYAHPYFHAAKRRNCFHPETEIEYRDDAGRHRETIETFVEDRLDDPRTDDFGTLVEELDGAIEVPSIDERGNRSTQPVIAVSKHPSQDHLVRVETQRGRSIRVTPDHTMLRVVDGEIQEVAANELEVGDIVPSSPSRQNVSMNAATGTATDGGIETDEVASVSFLESDVEYTYNLTVAETHTLAANDLSVAQCDGDEDCVMLLMDGLLNFSKTYLPDQRGGRMDAPLVMSSRIDPSEIDDEAHNVDIVREYPLELYEASRELADPEAVEELIQIGEDTLGTDDEYHGFDHTHDTTDIAMGPDLSAYKTLGDMMEKMDAQLELARKLRAVDETDVAERVIEYHFLPDIIGNLRAFSRQETRCLDCGEKYRRMPLTGECRECGGRVNLTVHEGSVSKYVDTAIEVAERFDCRPYTKQRLKVLEGSLESIFEDDTNKQSGIADFM
jgi:DNA polymerase II large subunit